MSRFPFGRPADRRPPRDPAGTAELAVLGVYPSALHVRWVPPDGSPTVGALAVDDEPTVFWDGSDAEDRIRLWKDSVGWDDAWGTVGAAGGNGSSGRHVVAHVLDPLRIAPAATLFTDCLPTYFVKGGAGSQGERIRTVYQPFADRAGLEPAQLPSRPTPAALVRRAVVEERSTLLAQLGGSQAPRVVTLGQEAADVLAAISGTERFVLATGGGYGRPRTVVLGGSRREWIPLTHPGNRTPAWTARHAAWAGAQAVSGRLGVRRR